MIRFVGCILLVILLVAPAVSAQESTPTPSVTSYTVVRGDTLGIIAARFHTTTRVIMDANNITNANLIFTGMTLQIPAPTPEPTAEPSPTPTEPPPTPLALSTQAAPTASIGFELGGEVFSFSNLDTMRVANMTWVKIPIRWSLGDSVNNARRAIELARRNNFSVLLQIGGSPQEFGSAPVEYTRSFAEYLGAVAALSPDAIEVWSDMNVVSGRISTGAYAQMLTAAFAAIKRADPQVLVISGALAQTTEFGAQCDSAGCDDLPYLRGLAAAGVGQSADCIGMRYTLGAVAPDATSDDPRGDQFLYYYPALVSAYATIFPDKPLCLTEIGYRVPGASTGDAGWATNTTPEDRAEWLAQALLLARQSRRVLLFIVYNVDATSATHAEYAIVGADGGCLACLNLGAAMRLPLAS